MEEHTILVHGRTAHYYEAGAGNRKVIVLVHGWPVCGYMWNPLMERLADRYRLIAVDLPGFGDSAPLHAPHTAQSLSQSLVAFIEAMRLPRVYLVGSSLGANVALLAAVRNPALVRKVVAHCPPYFPRLFVRLWQHNLWTRMLINKAGFLKRPIAGLFRSRFYFWWYRNVKERRLRKADKEFVNELYRRAKVFNLKAADETSRELPNLNLTEALRRVAVPALIVTGTRDVQPIWVLEYLAYHILPKGELAVMENATHRLPVTEAAKFAKLVEDFCK